MTKGGRFPLRSRRDDVADLDLPIGHNDPIDEEFDELPTLGKCEAVQGRL